MASEFRGPSGGEGLARRILMMWRGVRGRFGAERGPARDIAAEAIDEDAAYLARHPDARHERRILACMRSLEHRSPPALLEQTYSRSVLEEAAHRLQAGRDALSQRRIA